MRVQVTPERVELTEENAVEVFVTVHNTGELIGGYHLRVLGADPDWVTLETENLSLFPDATESVHAHIRIPPGLGAGERRIAVQVRVHANESFGRIRGIHHQSAGRAGEQLQQPALHR